MGIPVTVDSDHLDVLLHATGVARAIESIIKGAQRDQSFVTSGDLIAEAHDQLANAIRGALRARDGLIRHPTDEEKDVALHLAMAGAVAAAGIDRDNPHLYRGLVAAGLVEIGPREERVTFNAGSGAIWSQKHATQRLRLRDRGLEIYTELLTDENEMTERQSLAWLDNWERGRVDKETGQPKR